MNRKEFIYSSRIEKLVEAVRALEEPHHGSLRFSAHGYGEGGLHVSVGRCEPVRYLDGVPGLRELADDLNKACEPIIIAYAKALRQKLANECVVLAEKSLAARDAQT